MLRLNKYFGFLVILMQFLVSSEFGLANENIEAGDLLLKHEEIKSHEYSLGSYSDYKVITPPPAVKLSNTELYKKLDDIKNNLSEKKSYALMYDDDQKAIVIVDTTLIQGEANLRTALWDGWEHKVGVEASDLEVNTGFRKAIFKNTLLKFEEIFEIDGDLDNWGSENKVIGSVNFNF